MNGHICELKCLINHKRIMDQCKFEYTNQSLFKEK